MFTRKNPDTNLTGLEKVINRLLEDIMNMDADDDLYTKMVDDLEKLYKLKDIDRPKRVSLDTIATVSGQLLGIAMIVEYERLNLVTSKALGFLPKLG